jgi:hypothetical protein
MRWWQRAPKLGRVDYGDIWHTTAASLCPPDQRAALIQRLEDAGEETVRADLERGGANYGGSSQAESALVAGWLKSKEQERKRKAEERERVKDGRDVERLWHARIATFMLALRAAGSIVTYPVIFLLGFLVGRCSV